MPRLIPRLAYEHRIYLLTLAAALPAAVTALVMLWTGDYPDRVQWTLTLLILGFWFGFAGAVHDRVVGPLRTLANLLEALSEGDYSIRARHTQENDALSEVMQQVNTMSNTLRTQRLGAVEATALLRTVMEEIDVAVFAFDATHCLKLVNRAGERLLAQPADQLLNRTAEELNLQDMLQGEPMHTMSRAFPGATGRWGVRRTSFREGGLPHQLLVFTDITRPLREEELAAWQRLVRVLGHEINNSLTPIKSISGSLQTILQRTPRPEDWEEDMLHGLTVISSRSESLSRFVGAYAKLARLPRPTIAPTPIAPLLRHVVQLETRLPLALTPGPDMIIQADGDQLQQALINLIKNAVEASMETRGAVQVGWEQQDGAVDIWVRDEGQGLSNTANLFVPFFTTKPNGSGIGLVVSRQIAEAHGGTLTLQNRSDRRGAEARLRLPV